MFHKIFGLFRNEIPTKCNKCLFWLFLFYLSLLIEKLWIINYLNIWWLTNKKEVIDQNMHS